MRLKAENRWSAIFMVAVTILCSLPAASAAEGAEPLRAESRSPGIHVIPRPAKIEAGEGRFTLTAQSTILVSTGYATNWELSRRRHSLRRRAMRSRWPWKRLETDGPAPSNCPCPGMPRGSATKDTSCRCSPTACSSRRRSPPACSTAAKRCANCSRPRSRAGPRSRARSGVRRS